MSNEEVEDFLSGGGAPSVSFLTVGSSITGEVVESSVEEQTTPDGDKKLFPDGSVRKQLVVTIQTDLYDPEIPNDDGQRRIFMKPPAVKSLKAQLRKLDLRAPQKGGRITVTFSGEEPPAKKGHNPTKLFEVEYTPPVGVSAAPSSTEQFLSEEPF